MPWKVTRCCFCLPLRVGLMGFGYLKLVATYINIVIMMFRMDDIFQDRVKWNPINYITLSLGLGVMIIDLIFNIIMLSGLHKGSFNLLDSYYGYNMFILGTQMVATGFLLPLWVHREALISSNDAIVLFFIMLSIACIVLTIQIYYIILVGSMVSILKAKSRRKKSSVTRQQERKDVIVDGQVQVELSRESKKEKTGITIEVELKKPLQKEKEDGYENIEFNIKQEKKPVNKAVSNLEFTQEKDVQNAYDC